jgi:tetratricopeptide (TPR) repeat protein
VVANFLDKTFPNDTATDSARHQLALMLNEEQKYPEAFEIIVKIRPGYSAMTNARQLEGSIASMLVAAKETSPEKRRDIFRRTVNDLGRVSRPTAGAPEEDVRGYLMCRLRLALLLLSQSRADPEIERNPATRGFIRSREVAEEVLGSIPTFENLLDKKNELKLEGLNLHGAELKLQALDVRTRALYLQGRSLVDAKDFDGAAKAIQPIVDDVKKGMLYDPRMQEWAGAMSDSTPEGDRNAELKIKISKLAAGIDKIRRDIVMVGFKLRCVQGNKDEAAKMLANVKLAGGGIETNQATFEQMARELAAQMAAFRREGKTKEADDLGAGLTLLLKEFTALKELNPATILFLGHTFYTVAQYDEALAQFAKIKVPVVPAAELQLLMLKPDTPWWDVDPTKIMNGQVRKKLQEEIRDYRFAQLDTARALHGAAKFTEAEKLLKEAIGDAAKKGYAFNSIDFRKELAHMYESKAATLTEVKAANAEWQKSIKEWTTLFQIAQAQVKGIKPKTETDAGTSPDEVLRLKNNFFDAYFEVQRALTTANIQIIKTPANLAAAFERIGKSINDLETINKFAELAAKKEPLITPEVAFRYWELLEKNPELKKAYKEKGGKFFLDKPNVE